MALLLAARLPSRSSASVGLDPSPLFGPFLGTMQASDVSSAFMPGLRPTFFPDTPRSPKAPGSDETSQFPYEGLPRMHRVSDRVEPGEGSRVAPFPVWPSALPNCVGAPDIPISRLDGWPAVIAVGTLITERPPHRTERAQFGHSAPTLGV